MAAPITAGAELQAVGCYIPPAASRTGVPPQVGSTEDLCFYTVFVYCIHTSLGKEH